MTQIRIPRQAHRFDFSPAAEAHRAVPSGAQVVVETLDCFSNKVTSPSQLFATEPELVALIGAYNPVSQPIHVDGAEPGDTLAVRIDAIELAPLDPFAVTLVVGEKGRIVGRRCVGVSGVPETRICPIVDGHVLVETPRGTARLPARPMVGTIGTAPAQGEAISLEFDSGHGGNIDCPTVTVGSTILLPVNVPGGLLSLGDVHAVMGEAEITGIALETHADVTITVDVLPGGDRRLATPRIDTAEAIGSVGCRFGAPLDENLARGFEDLHERLRADYGLSEHDAYVLLGAAARVQVDQCVVGGWTATYVSVPRAVLPGGRHWAGGEAA